MKDFQIKEIQELEKELGVILVAYHTYANLTPDQLEKIKKTGKEAECHIAGISIGYEPLFLFLHRSIF
ncbi:MAG: hypothetical protein ACXQT5_07760 [Candidatus Syntropharchaeia archaeon]